MTEIEQKLLDAMKLAAAQIRRCDYTPARSTLLAAIKDAEAKSANPVADADGWIPWAGGECPVAFETKVDVRHRDGNEYQGFAGYSIARVWDHAGEPRDIIAYRIVKEPK